MPVDVLQKQHVCDTLYHTSKMAVQLPVMQSKQHTVRGPWNIHLHTVDPGVQSHPKCVHLNHEIPTKSTTHQHIYLMPNKMERKKKIFVIEQIRIHWDRISLPHRPSWGRRWWSHRRARTPWVGSRPTRTSSRASGTQQPKRINKRVREETD